MIFQKGRVEINEGEGDNLPTLNTMNTFVHFPYFGDLRLYAVSIEVLGCML